MTPNATPAEELPEPLFSFTQIMRFMAMRRADMIAATQAQAQAPTVAPLPDPWIEIKLNGVPVPVWNEQQIRAAYAIPEGMVLVPRVPTDAMLEAGWVFGSADSIYRAMI